MELSLPCSQCGKDIKTGYNFCPSCGKQLRAVPIQIGTGKLVYVLLVSVLLPPLGLFWGIKYVFQDDQKTKITGILAIVLTIISFLVNLWAASYILGSLSSSVNGNIEQYRQLGL